APAKPVAAKATVAAKPAAPSKPSPVASAPAAASPVAQAIRKTPPSERIVVTANGVPSTGTLNPAPRTAANDSDADEAPEAGSLLAGPRNVTAYMNKEQLEHFRNILNGWKRDLMEEVDRTVSHMKDEAANFPDPNDRATQE